MRLITYRRMRGASRRMASGPTPLGMLAQFLAIAAVEHQRTLARILADQPNALGLAATQYFLVLDGQQKCVLAESSAMLNGSSAAILNSASSLIRSPPKYQVTECANWSPSCVAPVRPTGAVTIKPLSHAPSLTFIGGAVVSPVRGIATNPWICAPCAPSTPQRTPKPSANGLRIATLTSPRRIASAPMLLQTTNLGRSVTN